MNIASVKIDGVGSYRLRSYSCPANVGQIVGYHYSTEDTASGFLRAIKSGSGLRCRFCGQCLYIDSRRKATYTEEMVIIEEPV